MNVGATDGRRTGHRGQRAGQVLPRRARAGRGRPAGPARQRVRPARAERGGQDHDRAHPGHADRGGRRAGPGGRFRRAPRPVRGPPPDQPHRPVRRAGRGADRRGEPADDGQAVPAVPDGGPAARGRADRAVRADRGRPAAGGHLLGRDAPPARHRRQPGRPPVGDLPRRAVDRPRPAEPADHVAGHRGPGRLGGDRLPHHPVPGGGRPAGRAGSRSWTRAASSPRARPPSSSGGSPPSGST